MSSLSQADRGNVQMSPESVLAAWEGRLQFDAYTATTSAVSKDDIYAAMWQEGDEVEQGLQGHHHFDKRDVVHDRHGHTVASIYYGGERHGKRVMLDVKGYRTEDAVYGLRKAVPQHRCTRMDSRMDFDAPGAFDALLEPLLRIKARKNLRGSIAGDWDHPEDGRTQYVGSPKSAVRVRLYEKGKEPGYRQSCRFDWCRLEIQVRPQKEAKEIYAAVTPLQAWGAAEWTRELAGELLQRTIAPLKAEATKLPSVDEHKLYWMCKQYGAPMLKLLNHYEGDLEAFGGHINSVLAATIEEEAYARSRIARAKAGHG